MRGRLALRVHRAEVAMKVEVVVQVVMLIPTPVVAT